MLQRICRDFLDLYDIIVTTLDWFFVLLASILLAA